jgi:hypothetical protein
MKLDRILVSSIGVRRVYSVDCEVPHNTQHLESLVSEGRNSSENKDTTLLWLVRHTGRAYHYSTQSLRHNTKHGLGPSDQLLTL